MIADQRPMRLKPRRRFAAAIRGVTTLAIALVLLAFALTLIPRERLQGWADFIGVGEYAAIDLGNVFGQGRPQSEVAARDHVEGSISENQGDPGRGKSASSAGTTAASGQANDEMGNTRNGRTSKRAITSASASPSAAGRERSGSSGKDVVPVVVGFAMEAEARVLPDGSNCALVSNRDVEVRPIAASSSSAFAGTPHAGLCSVAYRARNTSDAPLYLWLQVTPLTSDHRYRIQRKQGQPVGARVEPGDALSLYIVPRAFGRDDVSYRIFALASPEPSPEVLGMLPPNETAAESDPSRLVERARALGLSTEMRTHEILAR